MEQSIRLGRIAGIEIGLNWSLLLVFWLVAWSLAAARFPSQFTGYPTAVYWVAGVATAVVFFASLLAHELSHAVVARRAGVRVEGITLWLFGGVARFRGEAMTPREELRIAVVGPLMSLVLAGAFALVAFLLDAAGVPDLIVGTAAWLGFINAILAIFNLVPAFPLDGGRVLRAVLWGRNKTRLAATRTAALAGRVFGYLLIGFGLFQFAFAAVLGGVWFVFLGWFLLGAAQAEESQTMLRSALKDVSVEDIMSADPIAVPVSTSVDSFINDYVMRHHFSTFPVKDEAGAIVGLVTIGRVKQVAHEERSRVSIDRVACSLEDVGVAAPDEPAVAVLERMQSCPDGRALVLEDNSLRGIVSPRDVQRALDLAGLRGQAA